MYFSCIMAQNRRYLLPMPRANARFIESVSVFHIATSRDFQSNFDDIQHLSSLMIIWTYHLETASLWPDLACSTPHLKITKNYYSMFSICLCVIIFWPEHQGISLAIPIHSFRMSHMLYHLHLINTCNIWPS